MSYLNTITTKEELCKFILNLTKEHKENPTAWENHTLDRFLSAMAAFLEDIDGFYNNTGEKIPDKPEWGMFADILRAATMYE